jgi:hypothetical protein
MVFLNPIISVSSVQGLHLLLSQPVGIHSCALKMHIVGAGGVAQVVKHEALSSNFSTAKNAGRMHAYNPNTREADANSKSAWTT